MLKIKFRTFMNGIIFSTLLGSDQIVIVHLVTPLNVNFGIVRGICCYNNDITCVWMYECAIVHSRLNYYCVVHPRGNVNTPNYETLLYTAFCSVLVKYIISAEKISSRVLIFLITIV